MFCPTCRTKGRVIDSRDTLDKRMVRRRYCCLNPVCEKKFSTYEREVSKNRSLIKQERYMERRLRLILKIANATIFKKPVKRKEPHAPRE